MNQRWTIAEENRLIEYVSRGMTTDQVALRMIRSVKSIESRRTELIKQGRLDHSGRGPKVVKAPPLPANPHISMVLSAWTHTEVCGSMVSIRTVRSA